MRQKFIFNIWQKIDSNLYKIYVAERLEKIDEILELSFCNCDCIRVWACSKEMNTENKRLEKKLNLEIFHQGLFKIHRASWNQQIIIFHQTKLYENSARKKLMNSRKVENFSDSFRKSFPNVISNPNWIRVILIRFSTPQLHFFTSLSLLNGVINIDSSITSSHNHSYGKLEYYHKLPLNYFIISDLECSISCLKRLDEGALEILDVPLAGEHLISETRFIHAWFWYT